MNPILRATLVLGAVLFVSVTFAGLCFTACSYSHFGISTGSWSGNFPEKAERTEVHELHLASGSTLRAHTPYGVIRVRASDDGTGSAHAVVRTQGKTVADAQARLGRARINVSESAAGTTLSIEFERDADLKGAEPTPSVDFEISVPAGVKLDLGSDSGDLVAETGPFGESRLVSSYGNLRIENVQGDAVLKSSSGNVSIARLSGGAADAQTDYGNVKISAVDGTAVRARTSSGNVRGQDLRAATIALDSDYGNINVTNATGKLSTRTSSGNIKLEGVQGALSVSTDYGRVDIDGIFDALTAHSSSGDVRVRAGSGSTVASAWKIDSSYGRVALQAPKDLSFDLDARTDYGDVDVGYAIELPAGSTTKKGPAIQGKVNGGGALVELKSSSGAVSVKPLDP
ncbi:MAG: DUF4097 family beta strand repeat protein [Planctomycetes bacterium]|nr:DUF4097 family beta strand repeat protein [Planctomycetota bacterium]